MRIIATLFSVLSILSTTLLLVGCKGGGETASTGAAPALKPATQESTAAAAKRYSQDVGPNTGP